MAPQRRPTSSVSSRSSSEMKRRSQPYSIPGEQAPNTAARVRGHKPSDGSTKRKSHATSRDSLTSSAPSSSSPAFTPINRSPPVSTRLSGHEISPISPEEPDVEADDQSNHEIIAAIDFKEGGAMGCAYFNAESATLYIAEDIPLASSDVAEHFLTYVRPTILVVSRRAPEEFLGIVENLSLPPQEEEQATFVIRKLLSAEFSNSLAHERLCGLELDLFDSVQAAVSMVDGDAFDLPTVESLREPNTMRLLRCASLINLESHVSVNCAGAVITELHRRRSAECLLDNSNTLSIFQPHSLKMFCLLDSVFVSEETQRSLQIMHSELHPNSQIWGASTNSNGAKESLSVYGLFHLLTFTSQGRKYLRQIFLRPTRNMDLILERHKTISCFLRPDNADIVAQIAPILRKIKNLRKGLTQLHKGIGSATSNHSFDKGVWATLRGFAVQALRLKEMSNSLHGGKETTVVQRLLEAIQPSVLMKVGEMVNKTIDFDQSSSRHRISVKAGIDAKLDRLKRKYDGMSSLLEGVVKEIKRNVPERHRRAIQSCISLPQLGFFTVVEIDPRTEKEVYGERGEDGDRWEHLFTADGLAYLKNRYMKELDGQFGDMYCEIGDREVEIIQSLVKSVLEHEDSLATASDVCGEFDALMALARGAQMYGWIKPTMTTRNEVDIQDGRHPLQELVVATFVPNDCRLSGAEIGGENEDHGPALVLTGPNHSGKSIFLKQTAIIVYLAHVGSFVPATRATISLTDKILTRISTRESVSRNESAFAIDLKQVAQATRCATAQSLVLIDEFGKGTNSDDGAGLLAAMLHHFLSLGAGSPRLLVATHFHELFEEGYLKNLHGLNIAHMDVRTDPDALDEDGQVTYLFKLVDGYSCSSFGGKCAALNGVPSAIVARAEAIALLVSRNEDLRPTCAILSDKEKGELKEAESVARQFLEIRFDDNRVAEDRAETLSTGMTLENLLLTE